MVAFGDHQKNSHFVFTGRPKKKKKPVGKSVIISDIEMREPKWRSPCTWKWEKLKKVGGMKYHSPEVKIKSGTVGLTKWS